MAQVPNVAQINLRIDQLVAAIAVAPDRTDLKLKLALLQSMQKKHIGVD